MAFCLLVTTCMVVLLVWLAYAVYVPIPSGFSQPWRVQLAYSYVKFIMTLATTAETLGLGPAYKHVRTIFDLVGRIKQKLTKRDDSLKILNEQFDGVSVRVYIPIKKATFCPGFVFFHGGGWTIDSVDSYDGLTRKLAKGTKAVIVSVDYRRAPEHIFPAAFDDCVTATKFFMKNADDFGVDNTRIGVGGDSAGGNLAAAISLKLRDDAMYPKIKIQLLIYPPLQLIDRMTPSNQQNRNRAVLGRAVSPKFWSYYLQGHARNSLAIGRNLHTTPELKRKMSSTYLDVSKLPKQFTSRNYVPPGTDFGDEKLFKELEHLLLNPYAAPLMADDLSNLPKAYIFTGVIDALRDHGFWYAHRLREAGVEVQHRYPDIAFHGIFKFHDLIPEGNEYVQEFIDYLNLNL